jgi:hypothetical protein
VDGEPSTESDSEDDLEEIQHVSFPWRLKTRDSGTQGLVAKVLHFHIVLWYPGILILILRQLPPNDSFSEIW